MAHWFLILVLTTACALAGSDETPLTLERATGEALANNPAIQTAWRKWNAARARIPQAKSWEDPRLSYDQAVARFVVIPANGFTDQSLTLEQIVPISGKNLSRTRIAAAEALMAYEAMRRVQLDVVSRLRTACTRIKSAIREQALNEANAEALSLAATVARSRYQAGTGDAAAALQAEIESAKLDDERLELARARSEAQTQINVLMNRPAAAPVIISLAAAPAEIGSEAALARELLARRPEVRSAKARLAAEQARVQLARREWMPDPAVSVNAQRYNAADQAVSQVGAGVSFSLPWVNERKYSAGTREAEENAAAAAADLQRVQRESLGLLRDQLQRIEVARHHYALFSGTIQAQAQQAAGTAQLGYTTGKIRFADWVSAQRGRRDVEASAAQMLADYETAVAELDAIVGREPRASGPAANVHPKSIHP